MRCGDAAAQSGRETVERLFSVTSYIRIGAIVLVALLVFVAFVFINNTIRLAINARRREIAIIAPVYSLKREAGVLGSCFFSSSSPSPAAVHYNKPADR